jgi:hypothetical protein
MGRACDAREEAACPGAAWAARGERRAHAEGEPRRLGRMFEAGRHARYMPWSPLSEVRTARGRGPGSGCVESGISGIRIRDCHRMGVSGSLSLISLIQHRDPGRPLGMEPAPFTIGIRPEFRAQFWGNRVESPPGRWGKL